MKTLPYVLILILAFGLGWCSRSPTEPAPHYDTIYRDPTIVREVKVDTQYILFPVPYLAWVDSKDTIYIGDSCWHLREYKEYRDSNYYAKVSGIAPRLDELRVYPQTVYETKYIYRDVIKNSKPKRWGIGLSAGYGIGKNGLSPILAATLNYNLWNF